MPPYKELGERVCASAIVLMQAVNGTVIPRWRATTPGSRQQVDLPIAGLITDLKARGLLEETRLSGEFGRTPRS